MAWPAREGFPKFVYDISNLQQRAAQATVSTLLRATSVLRELQTRAQRPAMFFPPGDATGQLAVGLITDASFDRQPRGGSQQGYLLVLGDRRLVFADLAPSSLIAWSSTRIHGVVRSTLAAEAAAMATGYDAAVYLRAILVDILCPTTAPWTEAIKAIPQLTWTNCRSLHDLIHKEGSLPSERRVALDIYDVRQYAEVDDVLWIPTAKMLADPLTKHISSREATALREFLDTAQFFIRPDCYDIWHIYGTVLMLV